MKFMNPIQMNDWDVKDLILIVFIFQLILWITANLQINNSHLPIIRELSSFIVLFFLNGVIILRILKIHELGNIKTILYSVGLSIASLMFLGMLIDLVYPLLGILQPISLIPLLITFTVYAIFLCALAYLRDGNYNNPSILNTDGNNIPILIFLLLPFLSIFGTYIMNYYQNSTLLILMFLIIAFIPFLVAFDKFIPREIYPLAILSIALTLIFSSSLFTNYISGWDINPEFYFTNIVENSSYWDPSIPDLLNAMLSLVITVPIFSKISGLSIVDIFKIAYPAIFTLVPLSLYQIFKNQTNARMAFMGSFLFVSVFMFFLEMPGLARQEIGELFFVLLVMLMVETKLNDKKLSILTIIFIPALLVSHYSMDYIYIFLVLTAYIVISIRNLNLPKKYNRLGTLPIINYFFVKVGEGDIFKIRYKLQLILLVGFTISYYLLVSSSVLFHITVATLNNLISMSYLFLFNPKALMAVSIVTSDKSFLRTIALILHLIIEALIAVGILFLLTRRIGLKLNENYGLFSVMSFFMLILVLVVPFLAGALNPERFYQIALIFLSIFFVVGFIAIFNILNRILRHRWSKKSVYKTSLKLIALFLAISLIFNSGVVYELFGDKPSNISLHNSMDGPKFNTEEVNGAAWIATYRTNTYVFGDEYRSLLLYGYIPYNQSEGLNDELIASNQSYLFFGSYNIQYDKVGIQKPGETAPVYKTYKNSLTARNKIYDDGGSQIWH
jgi:uncharacterized membrane protein